MFYICRPNVPEEIENGEILLGDLLGKRWWYQLVQVCRRWRYLILGSASYLRLALLCTHGTRVADMLRNSPPLPLIIDHYDINHGLTPEDEEGMMLALQHRNRVQIINLRIPVPDLQKLVMAMDGEFPILELLNIEAPAKHKARLSLPPTFEAPRLRHLWLDYFTSPIGSPLLTSAVGLASLILRWTDASYVQPELVLRSISLLPRLEQLEIGFRSAAPNSEIENQLSHAPIKTQATLPNLRRFRFWGISGYLEALLSHMTTPLLQILSAYFFNQLTFSVPHHLQFMMTTEYLRFSRASLLFYHDGVWMKLDNPPVKTRQARFACFNARISCRHLDWQVSSITQILNDLRPMLSSVADLTLDYRQHTLSSEFHNEVDPTLWCEFLGSFRNVETIRVHQGLVGDVSRSVRIDGESPLELLPELKELVCPTRSVDDKTFAPFIHGREVSGQSVKLVGKAFPVGRGNYYRFCTSTGGKIDISPDPDPLHHPPA